MGDGSADLAVIERERIGRVAHLADELARAGAEADLSVDELTMTVELAWERIQRLAGFAEFVLSAGDPEGTDR